MAAHSPAAPAHLETAFYQLYRDFFDLAEKKRRWSLRTDIPWEQCNRSMDPVVADVVESFLAVELYLPDYVSKAIPLHRASRGRTWFYANWGYEESKHSLALGDWLLRSGMRTDEEMADLEGRVFKFEWNLPHDNALAMHMYAMVQEMATSLTYRNLLRHAQERGDPALVQLLRYLSVDEQAHYSFFFKLVRLFLEHDRPGTLAQLRRVLSIFRMPAIHEMVDSKKRIEAIKALEVFNDDIYYRDVYRPLLIALGVSRGELRSAA
jgi:acyl-[acyl-carrier-protein] desaturase